ncbi:MAG: hypothetical protein LAT51_03435 [Flavobacteriaceae bacterium]|nr:hypothetical protein [Flavobacteriaceae bacterium]
MANQNLLFIAFIIIASFGLSFFQYYKAVFNKEKTAYLFLFLRTITYSILGILLLNLSIEQKNTEITNKELVLAVDNSNSISALADTTKVKKWVDLFLKDKELNEKFKIIPFQFGKHFTTLKELDFQDQETNLASVFTESKELVSDEEIPLILLSDGNPTFGSDVAFERNSTKFDVYPVVLGDTIQYFDSKIDQVNVNSYAFLNNKFPIETFVSYKGKQDFKTRIELKENGRLIDQKEVNFTSNQPTKRIQFEVLADEVGVKTFQIELLPNTDEKQTENNLQELAIEVVDESTKILILTSFLHPDLAVLKKSIESNQQREVEILPIQNYAGNLEGVNLLIFYQPTSSFSSVFNQMNQSEIPHIVITGKQTDYSFLNRIQNDFIKQISSSTEEYYPSFNEDFSTYQQEDIYSDAFPPLEDVFGSVELLNPASVLFYQKIQSIETKEPMLFFVTQDGVRRSYLLGEQLWRWRATSYLQENNSFETFDSFINNWIGYLSLNQKKSRLIVDAKSFYKTQQSAKIKATLFDQNYQLDKNSSLFIKFIDEENSTREFPMLFTNQNFEFNLDALDAGDYTY